MTTEERNELTTKVISVIEQLRPYLQGDGGDVKFVELTDDYVVHVELQGRCGSCPYSLMTLKNGIQNAVIEEIPQIKSVEAVKM